MKKILISLFGLPVFLLLAAAGCSYLLQWQERKAAAGSLKQLQRPPAVQGDGGNALLLLEYEADAATRRQWLQQYGHNALLRDSGLPAAIRAARLPAADESLNCTPRPDKAAERSDCLHTVRANLPAYRQAVAQHAKLLANADALSQYDQLHYVIRDFAHDALPSYTVVLRQNTAAAVDWAEGRQAAAIAHVCRNVRTGRTLMQSTNSNLLDFMIGNAAVAQNTQLLADMLAEQPDWAARLPESCAAAYAPFEHGQPNICQALTTEYTLQIPLLRQPLEAATVAGELTTEHPWLLHAAILYSPEHTQAILARRTTDACEAVEQATRLDQPPADIVRTAQNPFDYTTRPACWGNWVGCILADIGSPDHRVYTERTLDTLMQQRAFQAALAVYRLPPEQRRARLDSLLQQHAGPSRPLRYDASGGQIVFTPYDQRDNRLNTAIRLTLP